MFVLLFYYFHCRTFDRGLRPAKHLQLIAEKDALSGTSSTQSDTLHSIQMCHRRWKRFTHLGGGDANGCHNVLDFLQSNNEFVVDTFNVFGDFDELVPHVIFLGKRENLSKAIVHGGQVLGLDATFNVSCYKTYSLFAIMGRCPAGAYPLGYFITSSKGEIAVRVGLQLFKASATAVLRSIQCLEENEEFSPVAICIDTDDAENNAIRHVFPECIIILCHYHFMTNMVSEVQAGRHNLSKDEIYKLMCCIRKLAGATDVPQFKSHLEEMKNLSGSFYEYFDTNYLNERWISTFSEVTRVHLPLSVQRLCRSNMLTEVSFRTLKYIVFDGYINKRLDYLLYCICFKLYPYFSKRVDVSVTLKPRFLASVDVKAVGTLMYK